MADLKEYADNSKYSDDPKVKLYMWQTKNPDNKFEIKKVNISTYETELRVVVLQGLCYGEGSGGVKEGLPKIAS